MYLAHAPANDQLIPGTGKIKNYHRKKGRNEEGWKKRIFSACAQICAFFEEGIQVLVKKIKLNVYRSALEFSVG